MITLKRMIAAVAVGAAIAISGVLPGSAASLSGSAASTIQPVGQSAGKSDGVTLARERGGGGHKWKGGGGGGKKWGGGGGGKKWRGGGGGYKWKGGSGGGKWSGGGGKWKHHGGRGRHYRNRGIYITPFLYGGYDYYDYDYGGYSDYEICYRECRYEHGPRYCRKYWRRYC